MTFPWFYFSGGMKLTAAVRSTGSRSSSPTTRTATSPGGRQRGRARRGHGRGRRYRGRHPHGTGGRQEVEAAAGLSRRDQIKMSDEEVAGLPRRAEDRDLRDDRAQRAPAPDAALVRQRRRWSCAAGRSPSRRRPRTWSATPTRRCRWRTGVEYHELRGVMLECDVSVERETERVAEEYGISRWWTRYAGGSDEAREMRSASRPRSGSGCASRPTRDGLLGPFQARWHLLILEGPDPQRRQGHAPAPAHPHERQAAGAGGQQARALLRPRGDGRGRASTRSGSSSRPRPATRSARPPATARSSACRSPTSTRPSRWGWRTRC